MPKSTPPPGSEADKFAEQVKVAVAGRNARSKQTGRAGSTGAKKGSASSTDSQRTEEG